MTHTKQVPDLRLCLLRLLIATKHSTKSMHFHRKSIVIFRRTVIRRRLTFAVACPLAVPGSFSVAYAHRRSPTAAPTIFSLYPPQAAVENVAPFRKKSRSLSLRGATNFLRVQILIILCWHLVCYLLLLFVLKNGKGCCSMAAFAVFYPFGFSSFILKISCFLPKTLFACYTAFISFAPVPHSVKYGL